MHSFNLDSFRLHIATSGDADSQIRTAHKSKRLGEEREARLQLGLLREEAEPAVSPWCITSQTLPLPAAYWGRTNDIPVATTARGAAPSDMWAFLFFFTQLEQRDKYVFYVYRK